MPESMKTTASEVCRQIEGLLQQQHDALLCNDFQAVEESSDRIMRIAAGLSEQEGRQLAGDMEAIRKKHEQMILLLASKKEAVGAELAATRQKRNLNRSYGKHHE